MSLNGGAGDEPAGGARLDRWQNLVHAAFLLDEAPPGARPGPERARTTLENVLEVFPASLDPVDDFEAWAVRRLALALHRSLETP